MPLDPDARAVIERMVTELPPDPLPPEEMRAMFAAAWPVPSSVEPVGRIYERTIPGPGGDLRVRVYEPASGAGPFPGLVWFHGGGWVIGSLDENEATCRALCRQAGCVVMSVDYRLAPEYRFPAAAEDAYAAVHWIAGHGAEIGVDGSRLAVAGESSGGNLAAVTALMARDRGGPPLVLQLLASPVTAPPGDRKSYVEYADGYFLSRGSMEWFFQLYPRDADDLRNPYLAPLLAEDLSGLPPALVMTAEYDVLRDEGEEYAHRLLDAGVPCELVRYPGQIHGFFALLTEHLSISAVAHRRAAAALRGAFTTEGR
jgi:acetyl esterase